MARRPLLLLLAVACGGARQEPPSTPIRGEARHESREPTVRGLSEAIETGPIRFAAVELLGEGGTLLATTTSDAEGRFHLPPRPDATHVRVIARAPAYDVEVTRDSDGRVPHAVTAPVDGSFVDLRATIASGTAGAFHVLDTLVRGVEAAERWSGRTLPPIFAWWERGGSQEGTVYLEERPAGSGRYAVAILGGTEGAYPTSDADEHDEGLVLHELGHLVMERLTFDSSLGGPHPRGARLDPGLAWEEGRATWFALAVLGAPEYRDSLGIAPHGSLALDENAETLVDPLPGPGSEVGVIAVLWDLADGPATGLPHMQSAKGDDDPIALGPAMLLRAMIAHAEEPGAVPSRESFLEHLVAEGLVAPAAMEELLASHGAGPVESVWPRPLVLGETAKGRIDGVTEPAPSGGTNVPATGFDATDTYRLHVTQSGRLEIALTVDGSGRADERSDLDLELRSRRLALLVGSYAEAPVETVSQPVEPGWYVVRVFDGGSGNRADYRLRATLH